MVDFFDQWWKFQALEVQPMMCCRTFSTNFLHIWTYLIITLVQIYSTFIPIIPIFTAVTTFLTPYVLYCHLFFPPQLPWRDVNHCYLQTTTSVLRRWAYLDDDIMLRGLKSNRYGYSPVRYGGWRKAWIRDTVTSGYVLPDQPDKLMTALPEGVPGDCKYPLWPCPNATDAVLPTVLPQAWPGNYLTLCFIVIIPLFIVGAGGITLVSPVMLRACHTFVLLDIDDDDDWRT